MTYRIIAPGDDWNLPNYDRWSVCANDLPIINDMDSRNEAQECLNIILQIDEQQNLSLILKKSGLMLSQAPFSWKVFKAAFDHYKS